MVLQYSLEDDLVFKYNVQIFVYILHFVRILALKINRHVVKIYDKWLKTEILHFPRNQNQLLTNFLTTVSKTVDGKAVQNLICQILRNCPDQIRHYLPCLIKNIAPRPTTRWCSTMNFLCEVSFIGITN